MRDDTLQKILNIGIAFSKEKNRERLLDQILIAAMDITQCDGGTLYIRQGNALEFKIMVTRSQGVHQGVGESETTLPPVPLSEKHVCACGVLYRRLINIPDVYESAQYDFSGPKRYDAMTGYHTQSMLVVPLEDDKENVIGVVQLINALDDAGNVVKKQVMRLSVTLDHRTLDGAVVAKFQMDLRDLLQNPMSILL